MSHRQIDGSPVLTEIDPGEEDLPLRGGPVAPLEMRGR